MPGSDPQSKSHPPKRRHPWFVRYLLEAALAVTAIVWITDCAPHHRVPASSQPTTQKLTLSKPLIDFGHGAGGFGLMGTKLPHDRDALVRQLTDAYAQRAILPTSRPAVVAEGDHYPRLESLDIDLSGARLRPGYKPTENKSAAALTAALTIGRLSYVARPLYYNQGATNLTFTAKDVQLSLLQSRHDKAVLVMTEARDGHVDFQLPMADVQRVVLFSAKENAGKAAFIVTDCNVGLSSDAPRSISIALDVQGWWLLLPTSLHFTGRCDIDDHFNVHLSNLGCSGGNIGGPLLAALVDGAVKKYEGKVMPLAAFPGQKIKIQDLAIHIDDNLSVKIAFGS